MTRLLHSEVRVRIIVGIDAGRCVSEHDRSVPSVVAGLLGCAHVHAPILAEGGAIEVDGARTLMAARSSILNDNRNAGVSQESVEEAFMELLGIRHVAWLTGASGEVCASLGDCTDYHIDIAARFTIPISWSPTSWCSCRSTVCARTNEPRPSSQNIFQDAESSPCRRCRSRKRTARFAASLSNNQGRRVRCKTRHTRGAAEISL